MTRRDNGFEWWSNQLAPLQLTLPRITIKRKTYFQSRSDCGTTKSAEIKLTIDLPEIALENAIQVRKKSLIDDFTPAGELNNYSW